MTCLCVSFTRPSRLWRVVYARPKRSVEECLAIMPQERVRHLPIMEDGCLVGMISIGDLVKSIIAEQKFLIDE
jgi:CBS domain-containing protein